MTISLMFSVLFTHTPTFYLFDVCRLEGGVVGRSGRLSLMMCVTTSLHQHLRCQILFTHVPEIIRKTNIEQKEEVDSHYFFLHLAQVPSFVITGSGGQIKFQPQEQTDLPLSAFCHFQSHQGGQGFISAVDLISSHLSLYIVYTHSMFALGLQLIHRGRQRSQKSSL